MADLLYAYCARMRRNYLQTLCDLFWGRRRWRAEWFVVSHRSPEKGEGWGTRRSNSGLLGRAFTLKPFSLFIHQHLLYAFNRLENLFFLLPHYDSFCFFSFN